MRHGAARRGERRPAWIGEDRRQPDAATASTARRTWDPENKACGGGPCCFLKKDSDYTLTDAPGLVSGSY